MKSLAEAITSYIDLAIEKALEDKNPSITGLPGHDLMMMQMRRRKLERAKADIEKALLQYEANHNKT